MQDLRKNLHIKETLVPFEMAVDLREKGFHEPTREHYHKEGDLSDVDSAVCDWNDTDNMYSAPTLDVVRKWLHDLYDIEIEIYASEPMCYRYKCFSFNNDEFGSMEYETDECFYNYDQALVFAFEYCLEEI